MYGNFPVSLLSVESRPKTTTLEASLESVFDSADFSEEDRLAIQEIVKDPKVEEWFTKKPVDVGLKNAAKKIITNENQRRESVLGQASQKFRKLSYFMDVVYWFAKF